MSFRVLGESDTGDSTHYGGADMAKISKLFNGVSSVATVDIASNVLFRNQRLKLHNGTNVKSVTIRNDLINVDSDLYVPVPAGGALTDTMLTTHSALEVFNKTITAWNNELGGVAKLPSVRKYGAIQAGGVTGGGAGMGLLYGFQDLPVTG